MYNDRENSVSVGVISSVSHLVTFMFSNTGKSATEPSSFMKLLIPYSYL